MFQSKQTPNNTTNNREARDKIKFEKKKKNPHNSLPLIQYQSIKKILIQNEIKSSKQFLFSTCFDYSKPNNL